MKEKIQHRYNFKVRWQPGKQMVISGALSREPVEEAPTINQIDQYQCQVEKLIVHAIQDDDTNNVFGDRKLNQLLKKANEDPNYIMLRRMIETGFPNKKEMLPENCKITGFSEMNYPSSKDLFCCSRRGILYH